VENPASDVNSLHGIPLIEIDLGTAGTVRIGPSQAQPLQSQTREDLQPREELDITPVEDDFSAFTGKAGNKQTTAVLP
jgi:hypothetical protein